MSIYALRLALRRKFWARLDLQLEENRYRWPRLQKRRFQRVR